VAALVSIVGAHVHRFDVRNRNRRLDCGLLPLSPSVASVRASPRRRISPAHLESTYCAIRAPKVFSVLRSALSSGAAADGQRQQEQGGPPRQVQAAARRDARSRHPSRRQQRWLAQANASARTGNTTAPMYAPWPPARVCCRNPVTTRRRSVQNVKNPLASPNATEKMRSTLTPLICLPGPVSVPEDTPNQPGLPGECPVPLVPLVPLGNRPRDGHNAESTGTGG